MGRRFFSKLRGSNIIDGTLLIVVVSLAMIIVMSCLSSAPIADDWSFYTTSQRQSIWEFLDNSMHHTGRLGQWGLIYVGFRVFGMMAVRVVPIIMFVLMGVLLSWLISNLGILKKRHENWIVGFMVAEVGTLILPSVFDSFLWYDSAATGYASILAILLVINMCFYFIRRKPKLALEGLFYLVVAMSTTFSELSSMVLIGGLGLASIIALVLKRKDIYRYTIPFCIAGIIGFLTLYFSPGSIERRASAMPSFSLEWILIGSMKNILETFKETFSIWDVGLVLVCCMFIASKVTLSGFWKKHTGLLIILSIVSFIGITYGSICVNNYVQDYVPYRIYTLPIFGGLIMLATLTVGIVNLPVLAKKNLVAIRAVWIGLVLVVISGTIISSSSYIVKLNLRRQLVNYRDANVAMQRDSGNEIIYIVEAPLLVTGNAEDLYYYYPEHDAKKMIWVANNYAEYMGVRNREIVLVEPPAMYRY